MFWTEFLFAFVVAFLLTGLLVGFGRWRSPRAADEAIMPSFLLVFLLLMMLVWAGGVWMTPFGPLLWGGYWVPFLAVGVIVTLVLGSLGRPATRRPRNEREAREKAQAEVAAESVFGALFWMLMLVVIAAVVVRYL